MERAQCQQPICQRQMHSLILPDGSFRVTPGANCYATLTSPKRPVSLCGSLQLIKVPP